MNFSKLTATNNPKVTFNLDSAGKSQRSRASDITIQPVMLTEIQRKLQVHKLSKEKIKFEEEQKEEINRGQAQLEISIGKTEDQKFDEPSVTCGDSPLLTPIGNMSSLRLLQLPTYLSTTPSHPKASCLEHSKNEPLLTVGVQLQKLSRPSNNQQTINFKESKKKLELKVDYEEKKELKQPNDETRSSTIPPVEIASSVEIKQKQIEPIKQSVVVTVFNDFEQQESILDQNEANEQEIQNSDFSAFQTKYFRGSSQQFTTPQFDHTQKQRQSSGFANHKLFQRQDENEQPNGQPTIESKETDFQTPQEIYKEEVQEVKQRLSFQPKQFSPLQVLYDSNSETENRQFAFSQPVGKQKLFC